MDTDKGRGGMMRGKKKILEDIIEIADHLEMLCNAIREYCEKRPKYLLLPSDSELSELVDEYRDLRMDYHGGGR